MCSGGIDDFGSGPGAGQPVCKRAARKLCALKANILKAADKMPPENYSFKPTPDIRTYARVVNHVTEAQLHICGAADNVDASALPKVPAGNGG